MPPVVAGRTAPERSPDAFIHGDGVRLACYADGDPAAPTLVFVHGYPDTAHVWNRLVAELADDFHCVRYDVRGAGQSERPRATAAYRLTHLEQDLAAVLDWACPDRRPVHLIGHDWGSIQSWEAATDPALADRLASYTSISGPCLDHVGFWLRQQWQNDRAGLGRQLRRSWYVGLFQIPKLAPLGWRHLIAPRWADMLARLEGEQLPVAETLVEDGAHGIKLYRANIMPRLITPRRRHALVPVHVIVPRRDPFIGRGFVRGLDRWVDSLEVNRIDAGHWAIATHAPAIAAHCRRFFDAQSAESAPPAANTEALS